MARIRSTKPEFWHDRKLARSCSRDARMLYMGLWNQADEHGRCNGDSSVIKGQVFPFDDIDVAPLLAELAVAGRICPYMIDGDPFLFLPKLGTHQRLEPGKAASKFPAPPEVFSDPATVFSDSAAIFSDSPNGAPKRQVKGESEKICAGSEKKDASLCSREHVAGSMEHVARAERGADETAPRITQRSKRITDAYAAIVPLSNWPAVNGVVLKALKTERYADDEVHAAMLRIARDGRSVTTETLRLELEGLTPRASPNRATQRTEQGLSVIRNLQAESRGQIA